MVSNPNRTPSSLLKCLPTIYQSDPLLGQFLLAFEKILLGVENDNVSLPELTNEHKFPPKGIEEVIAGLSTYFDPQQTPDEFLSWLASWTAFSLRADIERSIQRQFISKIIKHYQWRGTKANLEELLQIFVRGKPSVNETALDGSSPHFFTVTIVLAEELQGDRQRLARQLEIANALIQLEKPAHTDYKLIPIFPGTIQIGNRDSSVLAVNTILGTMRVPPTSNS
jgi:P2-related tail formation protein